jgi:predicted phosphodiesterase
MNNDNAVLLKRVGVIGDIHAEDEAIVNVVTYFENKECDVCIVLETYVMVMEVLKM